MKIAAKLVNSRLNTDSLPRSNTRWGQEYGHILRFGRWGVDNIVEASGATSLLNESARLLNLHGTVSAVAFYEQTVRRIGCRHVCEWSESDCRRRMGLRVQPGFLVKELIPK